MVAVVNLLRVLARMSWWENKLPNVRNFIIQRLREGFTSINGNTRSNFCGEKSTLMLSGVSFFREEAGKLEIKCRPCSCPRPRI